MAVAAAANDAAAAATVFSWPRRQPIVQCHACEDEGAAARGAGRGSAAVSGTSESQAWRFIVVAASATAATATAVSAVAEIISNRADRLAPATAGA